MSRAGGVVPEKPTIPDAASDTGPWRLVRLLLAWAKQVPWCDWLELAGSLGRGAGDEDSDVDAGIGVSCSDQTELDSQVRAAVEVVSNFAGVQDLMVEKFELGRRGGF